MRTLALVLWVPLLAGACATSVTPRAAVQRGFATRATRLEVMEESMRVLDRNPDYVDELVAAARRHPRTWERLAAGAAARISDSALGDALVLRFAREPRALGLLLARVLAVGIGDPAARGALLEALEETTPRLLEVFSTRAGLLRACVRSVARGGSLGEAQRAAVRAALRDHRRELAELVVSDPTTLRALAAALLEAGAGNVRAALRVLAADPTPVARHGHR